MDTDFWHRKWQDQQIGFHQQDINSNLIKFWPALELDAEASVFVPLCGKSKDMLWLREQGHSVIGIELSVLACEAFFAEAGIEYEKTRTDEFDCYSADRLKIYCGNYFDLDKDHLGDVRGIYDRASLIALPTEIRQQFVTRLEQLFPSDISMLLVTMNYDQDKLSGPPFSVTTKETEALFSAWHIQCLEQRDILANEKKFQELGLSELHESVYLLTR